MSRKKEYRKKIIQVKYPDFSNAVKSITLTEEVITTVKRSININYKADSQNSMAKENTTTNGWSIKVELKEKYKDHPEREVIYSFIDKNQSEKVLSKIDEAIIYTEKRLTKNFGAYLNCAIKEDWKIEESKEIKQVQDNTELEALRKQFLELDRYKVMAYIEKNPDDFSHGLLWKEDPLTDEERVIIYNDLKETVLTMPPQIALLKKLLN